MERLPVELVVFILLKLPIQFAKVCARINKKFNGVMLSSQYWSLRIKQDFDIDVSKLKYNNMIFYELLYYKIIFNLNNKRYRHLSYLIHILYFLLKPHRKHTLIRYKNQHHEKLIIEYCKKRLINYKVIELGTRKHKKYYFKKFYGIEVSK